MKSELKCDSCEKNKKFQEDDSGSGVDSNSSNQQIVAKCFDCNYYLCSNCLLDHQLISSYSYHQLISLLNSNGEELVNLSNLSATNKPSSSFTNGNNQSTFQMSNLQQLQQQFANLEDQLLIKRRQQQQQQQAQQQQQQAQFVSQQSSRLVQIENEIQKTYNFYVQMLKERRDYLVNELNTIVQYALANHSQNYNIQLKLKVELERKRQSLEIAEAVASAIAASGGGAELNKSSNSPSFNDSNNSSHDSNNNKINTSLIELNNLSMVNQQMLLQLKNTNPLASIEFVSNYSAIQTSIRNTFGYIRINSQFNNSTNGPTNQPPASNNSIYDYLTSLNGKQPATNSELSVMCDFDSGMFNQNIGSYGGNKTTFDSDYLYNTQQMINTLSASSSGSSKSSSSLSSGVSSGSALSSSSLGKPKQAASVYSSLLNFNENTDSDAEFDYSALGFENARKSKSSGFAAGLSSYFSKQLDLNAEDTNLILSNLSQQHLLAASEESGGGIGSSVSSSASTTPELLYDSTATNSTLTKLTGKMSNMSPFSAHSPSGRTVLKRNKMIYHCKFGEFGINDGQFTEPSGVTINADNDIIVADTNSHRIQIFDREGRFKFKFGECGKRDGQLLYPNRVSVVKHTGDIVVTERSPTHQIQIYNKHGQFLRKFGANILQHPRGVCVDSKGRIIVVECKVMRVIIFDLMGNVLQKFNCSKYLEFPNGVCCSSNDREEIYISDNRAHCIKVFDYNGNFIRQIGGEGITNYPIGVGINTNNEILVADNHNNFNLTVFTQDGQLVNSLESKVKHAQCFDVGLMDDGSIVLASKDYRIYVYKYINGGDGGSVCGENTLANMEADFNEPAVSSVMMQSGEEHGYDAFSPRMMNSSCSAAAAAAVSSLTANYSGEFGCLSSAGCLTKSNSATNLIESINSLTGLI